MHRLTIALLQMTSCGSDQDPNRDKGAEFCRRAKEMGADIVLFPKMWNVGYPPFDTVPRNVLSLIDRHGEIILTYATVHTCAFDEPEASTTPGVAIADRLNPAAPSDRTRRNS